MLVGNVSINGKQGSSQAREESSKVISEGKRLLSQFILKSKDIFWSSLKGNQDSSRRRLETQESHRADSIRRILLTHVHSSEIPVPHYTETKDTQVCPLVKAHWPEIPDFYICHPEVDLSKAEPAPSCLNLEPSMVKAFQKHHGTSIA